MCLKCGELKTFRVHCLGYIIGDKVADEDFMNVFDKIGKVNINCPNKGAHFLYSCYQKKIVICQFKENGYGVLYDVEKSIREGLLKVENDYYNWYYRAGDYAGEEDDCYEPDYGDYY